MLRGMYVGVSLLFCDLCLVLLVAAGSNHQGKRCDTFALATDPPRIHRFLWKKPRPKKAHAPCETGDTRHSSRKKIILGKLERLDGMPSTSRTQTETVGQDIHQIR